MTEDHLKKYRNSIRLHEFALRKLIEQRDKINLDIEKSVDYITANANFLPEDEREEELDKLAQLVAGPPGFTDSVRNALRNNPSYSANAVGVRDMLMKAGFDMSGYSNPLASIHTILKRLAQRGEVSITVVSGEPFYRWKADMPRKPKRSAFYGE
jgi:hypothetical protein